MQDDELKLSLHDQLEFSRSRLAELSKTDEMCEGRAKWANEHLRAFHERKVAELEARIAGSAQLNNLPV